MFNKLKLLIKKDITEFKNNFKAKRGNWFGIILYAIFVLGLLCVGVFLYMELARSYVFSGGTDAALLFQRKKELLTISLGVFLIFNVVAGVKNMYKKLVSNADAEKLVILPIDDKVIFIYRIFYIFFKALVSSVLTFIPLAVVYGAVCNMGVGFYLMLIPMLFVFTFVSIGFSALLVIPYYYFKKFTEHKYVLLIIIYTIIMGAMFYFYSVILKALESLLVSGNLMYFFNEHKYGIIKNIADNLFPANLFSSVLLWQNVALNVLFIVVLCIGLGIIALGICGKFNKTIFKQESLNIKALKKPKQYKQKSKFVSLFCREMVEIIRKPSFAFALFVIAVDLPILVYICAKILNSLVFNLVYLDLSYQVSFFVILVFALLANTFCSSNISREGKNFECINKLPLTKLQILMPKVTLCFIVSFISVLACVIVLICTKMVSPLQGLGIWFVVECMCLAENLFASKYDLKHPTFKKGTNGEGNLNTQSMTVTTIISFLLAIAFIGAIFAYSIFGLLKGMVLNKFILYALPCIVGLIVLIVAFVYFFKGLNKMEVGHEK